MQHKTTRRPDTKLLLKWIIKRPSSFVEMPRSVRWCVFRQQFPSVWDVRWKLRWLQFILCFPEKTTTKEINKKKKPQPQQPLTHKVKNKAFLVSIIMIMGLYRDTLTWLINSTWRESTQHIVFFPLHTRHWLQHYFPWFLSQQRCDGFWGHQHSRDNSAVSRNRSNMNKSW